MLFLKFLCCILLFNFLLPATPAIRLALLISIYILISFHFIYLEFYFIGLTYIIVYIGAIAILFIFVIMLLNQQVITKGENIIKLIEGLKLNENRMNLSDYLILNNGPKRVSLSSASLQIITPRRGVGSSSLTILLALLLSITSITPSGFLQEYSYAVLDWSIDYNTLSDLMVLGYHLLLGYPIIYIQMGILLWILLIGILNIID